MMCTKPVSDNRYDIVSYKSYDQFMLTSFTMTDQAGNNSREGRETTRTTHGKVSGNYSATRRET